MAELNLFIYEIKYKTNVTLSFMLEFTDNLRSVQNFIVVQRLSVNSGMKLGVTTFVMYL